MQLNRFRYITDKPVWTRSIVLLIGLVTAAIVIDWRAITAGIVNEYGFQRYGETGIALSLGVVAFVLLVRRRKDTPVTLAPWRATSAFWLAIVIAAVAYDWIAIGTIKHTVHKTPWIITAHASIVMVIVCLLLAAYGFHNLRAFWRNYHKELYLAAGFGIAFGIFLYLLYMLWPFLSSTVLRSVKYLFDSIGIQAIYEPKYTLLFHSFGVQIGEYCSGIDSMALFTALYALIGTLDWNRFNHRRYFLVFPAALLIMFGFNILRVFVLILAGYYINPHIAFSLFHTYAGMIFFIIYSVIFWSLCYHRLLADRRPQKA